MDELRITEKDFSKGVTVESGRRHRIVLDPDSVRLGFFGMYFDTDKNFVLPRGLKNLKRIQAVYERFPNAKLLIVGHTDTAGTPDYNDALSLERAEAVAAYLKDDVDAWLARYESSVKESKRWGRREDLAMLRHVRARSRSQLQAGGETQSSLPKPRTTEDMVRRFQREHGLEPTEFWALSHDGPSSKST